MCCREPDILEVYVPDVNLTQKGASTVSMQQADSDHCLPEQEPIAMSPAATGMLFKDSMPQYASLLSRLYPCDHA